MGEAMDDQTEWLAAEKDWQREKIMGALADALLNTPDIEAGEIPLVVPGPVLERMAERQLSTGVRVGTDWVAEDVGVKVLPQWQRQGLDQEREARPDPVAPWDGALPENAGAAVSLADLKEQHGGA